MGSLSDWLGDINAIDGLGRSAAGLICIVASAFCGALIGLEREYRDKPAGVRTVLLICLGSTIFTIVSLLLAAQKPMADPARLAAQVVTGIGFLGAGAILRARGTIVGLTTGATIWAVSAVGVTIGAGYVAAAFVFTAIILVVLTAAQHLTPLVAGRCVIRRVTIVYRPDNGKTWPRIQAILDRHGVRDDVVSRGDAEGGLQKLDASICLRHHDHRIVLATLAEQSEVTELRTPPGNK